MLTDVLPLAAGRVEDGTVCRVMWREEMVRWNYDEDEDYSDLLLLLLVEASNLSYAPIWSITKSPLGADAEKRVR